MISNNQLSNINGNKYTVIVCWNIMLILHIIKMLHHVFTVLSSLEDRLVFF